MQHTARRCAGRPSRIVPAGFGLVLLVILWPVAAGAAIIESVNAVLEGNPLIVRGSTSREAVAVQKAIALQGWELEIVAGADADSATIATHDLLVFGTPWTNPLVAQCLQPTPLRLERDAIVVGDSLFAGNDIRLVAALPNPLNPQRHCVVYAAQDEQLLSGILFGYGASNGPGDFIAYRLSDGVFYEEDRLVSGSLRAAGAEADSAPTDDTSLQIDAATYWSKPPRSLRTLRQGHVTLHYDTLSESEARALARFVDTLRSVAEGDYGIPMPDPIRLYMYSAAADETKVTMYTDAWGTFWKKLNGPKDAFLSSDQAPVAYAHEVARLAFQPVIRDSVKRGPLKFYDDDWSHYFQHYVLIPAAWEQLGPSGWPVTLDYHANWGRDRFDRLYEGGEDTYAFLLAEIERTHGRAVIGTTVNEVTHDGANRNVAIELFMERLAQATGDTLLMQRVAQAWPTPFEYSLRRRMHPLGFHPDLDDMIWGNTGAADATSDSRTGGAHSATTITAVDSASAAVRAGIREGDVIVGIDGYRFDAQKGQAVRRVLQAIQESGAIVLDLARDDDILHITLDVEPRQP